MSYYILKTTKKDHVEIQNSSPPNTVPPQIAESSNPCPQLLGGEVTSSYKSATSNTGDTLAGRNRNTEIEGLQPGQNLANYIKMKGTPSLLPIQIQRLSDICTSFAKIIKRFIINGKMSQDEIIQAKGLVVFKNWQVAAGPAVSWGSGIVLIRRLDGTWSPPYAISMKSCGGGVAYGLGRYECLHILDIDDTVKDFIKGEWKFSSQLTAVFGRFGATRSLKESQGTLEHTRSCGLYFGMTTSGIGIEGDEDKNTEIYGLGLLGGELLWDYPVTDEIKIGMQSLFEILQ